LSRIQWGKCKIAVWQLNLRNFAEIGWGRLRMTRLDRFLPKISGNLWPVFFSYEGDFVCLTAVEEKSKGFHRDVEKLQLWSS